MLQNKTVADYLTEQLNSAGTAKEFKFKVYADAADFEKSWTIQGVLVTANSDGSPLENFTQRKYEYMISFNVIDHQLGSRIQAFNDTINLAITNMQGSSAALDSGNAVFTFDTPTTHGVGNELGLGTTVYTRIRFNVLYSVSATTTSNKIWLLDGVALPYLDESIDLDTQGATNNIYGLNATQSLPIKQTKYYRFTLPYDNTNSICAQLQKDMLGGNMSKVYKLSYYDGVSYTEAEPFTASVSLFRTSGSGATRPSVSNFTIVLTDVDSNDSGSVSYEMALIDNEFDDSSVNARWFADRTAQQAWFADRIAVGAPYSIIKAPNLNSLTITQQVYFNASNLDLNALLTKNYAIIKAVDKASGNVLQYYYYFVQTANVGANNQILLDLKMDSIQTYYFDPNMQIADCMINRAHLNRFADAGNGVVKFDGTPSSKLFEREPLQNLAKRLVSREKLRLRIDKRDNSQFNNWLNDNIQCWVYAYLIPSKRDTEGVTQYNNTYQVYTYSGGTPNYTALPFYSRLNHNSGGGFISPLSIVCYPIYKTDNRIIGEYKPNPTSTYSVEYTPVGFDGFQQLNDGTSRVYNCKISMLPPFNAGNYINGTGRQKYQVVNGNLILNLNEVLNNEYVRDWNGCGSVVTSLRSLNNGMFTPNYQMLYANEMRSEDILFDVALRFLKEEIVGRNRHPQFNPKLLGADYRSLRITNSSESYDYDIQKLGNENGRASFLYNEIFGADITRQYIRYNTTSDNEIYVPATSENYTGLVTAEDYSIPYATSQLDTFLANNKNFFQQRNIGLAQSAMNVVGNVASNVMTGNIMGAISSGIGGSIGVGLDLVQSNLTMDNMASAPALIKNANGNALFNATINDCAIFAERYSALSSELKSADDYMYLNGYTYGQVDNIKNCDNIRHYFNFVQANIETISGVTMSNNARNDIRNRFAQGIRFWNSDQVQYEKENYENWLEN